MKLKSLRKSGFLTILLGIAFLTSATPTFAHNNLVFRSCLIQCLEEICQEYSRFMLPDEPFSVFSIR